MATVDHLPGRVTSVVLGPDLIVWLYGEVDQSLRPALALVAEQVRGHRGALVVDAEGLTFCDGTLAGFLAEASGQGPVSLRSPSRLVRDLLRVYGLDGAVSPPAG
jgi:anti-anti-sigma regulatory factor